MATQSLYRRYRPQRFSEVKGQDHVVRALRNAVAEGREGQAYLFSGPRGTGKTSSARILAKVLNCEHPDAGEPCCECESCVAVERGTSYDVHELDAASNNGVDAMRDLIEKASLGTPGRHKVYILDEVHMLSKAAEAALLKTLEEPPSHVVFVLATTDPQKMSDTIISRTQHLQFHLLPADTLQDHVRWVAQDAGLDVSDAAVERVLDQGAGSARDALSALELVANAGDDGVEAVALDEFVEAMIERDAGRALTMVGHAISLGSDPRTLTEELIGYLRNGFLALMAPELVQLPSQRVDAFADQARRLGPAGLVRGIEHLGSALGEMRHAPDPRVLLDVATVQLTSDLVAPDLPALLQRLDRLERQMASGAPSSGSPPAGTAPSSPDPVDPETGRAALGGRAGGRRAGGSLPAAEVTDGETAGETAAARDAEAVAPPASDDHDTRSSAAAEAATPAAPATPDATAHSDTASTSGSSVPGVVALTADMWENTVRPSLRGMARAVYAPAQFVRSTADSLTLSVPNAVHRGKCEQHRPVVEQAVSSLVGAPVTIELVDDDGGSGGSPGTEGGDSSRSDARSASSGSTAVDAAPRGDRGSGGTSTRGNMTTDLAAPSATADPATGSGAARPGRGAAGESPRAAAERAARTTVSAAHEIEVPPRPVDLPDDDEIDLDDLVDAPPESVKTPIDRLAEAFPGSELIDETG